MSRRQQNFGYDNGRRSRYSDQGIALPAPRPQGEYDSWGSHTSSEDVEVECPLCLEPLDETDQTFFPCPCGYQMCLYCFNRIKDKNDHLKDTCPACRTKYSTESYRYITAEEAAENRRKNRKTTSSEPDQQQQLAQIAAMSEARAKAMAAQAKRCGACQVEGPPLAPDPSFKEEERAAAAAAAAAETVPMPVKRNNSWASLAAGGNSQSEGAPADQETKQVSGELWEAWPSLEAGTSSSEVAAGVDDWDGLAQEVMRQTHAPSQAHSFTQQQQQSQQARSGELEDEISRVKAEIATVVQSVAAARAQLSKEEALYDEYQEKCAELRLKQQNWDAGMMDMLSRWQGWTDSSERSEVSHFEEESMIMAQLITHQQDMAEAMSELSAAPVSNSDSSWSRGPEGTERQPACNMNASSWDSLSVFPQSIGEQATSSRLVSGNAISGSRLFGGASEDRSSAWGASAAVGTDSQNAWAQPNVNLNSTSSVWGSSSRPNHSLQGMQPSVWGGGNGVW